MIESLSYKKEIINILCDINDKKIMQEFLHDLLTKSELSDIVTRWQIIKQLDKGIPQRQISKNLGVSISNITRGSLELQNKKGGFRNVLDKFKHTEQSL